MNNSIQQIKEMLQSGQISIKDLSDIVNQSGSVEESPNGSREIDSKQSDVEKQHSSWSVAKVMYIIGGLVVVLGVFILLAQNWQDIGSAGRIISTLGLSIVAYYIGFYLFFKKVEKSLVEVYFVISSILFPVGLYVLLSESGLVLTMSSYGLNMTISLVSLLVFSLTLYITSKKSLHIVSAIFATWFMYACAGSVINRYRYSYVYYGYGSFVTDMWVYTTMLIGIGHYFYGKWINSKLTNLFTMVSFAMVLFGGLFLDGIWDLLYVLLLAGALTLCIKIKSTKALFITSIAVAIYIIKISSEYFADSFGWPLLLVLIGFLIIGLGYATYYLNKRYITN
jgi:uncharacterized membrane protein